MILPITLSRLWLFQLTTSRRGRPGEVISPGVIPNFNSRPHEEVDSLRRFQALHISISTHDLTKRSTRPFVAAPMALLFQLTTSRRGRPIPASITCGTRVFQLTTSRRGRRLCDFFLPGASVFQLTTSRRGRRGASGNPGGL